MPGLVNIKAHKPVGSRPPYTFGEFSEKNRDIHGKTRFDVGKDENRTPLVHLGFELRESESRIQISPHVLRRIGRSKCLVIDPGCELNQRFGIFRNGIPEMPSKGFLAVLGQQNCRVFDVPGGSFFNTYLLPCPSSSRLRIAWDKTVRMCWPPRHVGNGKTGTPSWLPAIACRSSRRS